ncbi:hypothetical protein CLV36_11455 [Laceyella sediminis]|uniref:Lipoprotein n=1 Tax=Laceyella sediminis TaxID=573074 RepID=A0ABX5EKL9_9BACL|nr:hypothetical protein [Laceyella sediminis]PRZ12391.1 hypothetical protein CLV36_11455 [Laceyella sediminis]
MNALPVLLVAVALCLSSCANRDPEPDVLKPVKVTQFSNRFTKCLGDQGGGTLRSNETLYVTDENIPFDEDKSMIHYPAYGDFTVQKVTDAKMEDRMLNDGNVAVSFLQIKLLRATDIRDVRIKRALDNNPQMTDYFLYVKYRVENKTEVPLKIDSTNGYHYPFCHLKLIRGQAILREGTFNVISQDKVFTAWTNDDLTEIIEPNVPVDNFMLINLNEVSTETVREVDRLEFTIARFLTLEDEEVASKGGDVSFSLREWQSMRKS